MMPIGKILAPIDYVVAQRSQVARIRQVPGAVVLQERRVGTIPPSVRPMADRTVAAVERFGVLYISWGRLTPVSGHADDEAHGQKAEGQMDPRPSFVPTTGDSRHLPQSFCQTCRVGGTCPDGLPPYPDLPPRRGGKGMCESPLECPNVAWIDLDAGDIGGHRDWPGSDILYASALERKTAWQKTWSSNSKPWQCRLGSATSAVTSPRPWRWPWSWCCGAKPWELKR